MRNSWARPVSICGSAFAVWLLAEFLLFHGSFYRRMLEPDSYAGQVELLLATEHSVPAASSKAILVVGDSRIREGFSAQIANQSVNGAPIAFTNGGIPGSTPRSWFYVLRELDPDASRYGAIVLAVDDYRDEDGTWSWADYPIDLPIAIACLRLGDVPSFAASFHQAVERFHALRGALLKGFVYKDDLQAFLTNPPARIRKVADYRAHAFEWSSGYPGRPESLAGLSVDWASRSIHFPPGLTPAQRGELSADILRATAAQTGDTYRYRKYWLARILERYRSGATRVFFVRLPRSPVHRLEPALHLPSAIRDLAAANPRCILLDENAFSALERPEYFFDSLHLNAEGRVIFSRELAGLIREAL